jgi:predicted nucleic-acid-binding protein
VGGEGSQEPVKSLDTNILIRVITKDHPIQTPLAASVLDRPVFVSHGVLMETEWVLRSRYQWPRNQIATALRLLLDVGTVKMVNPELIAWSLDRYVAGADFADMLHIVASKDRESFLSFETDLAAIAGPDAPTRVERLA